MSKSVQLLSKVSVATVYGKVAKLKEGESKQLVRVIGIATGVKTGSSTYGDWLAFTGNFKGINLDTGEEFRGGKVFLPAIAQNLVEGALQNADAESVQFAFDIGVKYSGTVAQGYEYTVTPLVEAQDNDPLTQLEKQLSAPQLAAPKAEGKTK